IRQFVSDASHELRTPLVTIRGYAELYRQGAITKSDDIGNAMERMESEAKRMGVLVDDLVVLARLDEQRPAEIGPVDLHRIARDAAADAAAQAPDRDISFIGLDGEDAQPVPMIRGSESKIRQVVVNLAGNAVRHTPEHTAIEFAVGVVGGRAEASAESAEASNGQDTESKTGANKTGANKAAAKDKSRERGFVTGGVRIFRRGDSNGNDQNDAQAPAGIVPDMTAAGSITVDDSLRGFPNGRVRIEVRDHGDGIDPEVVPRIFERFYRLDVSRTRDTGGSGLGLSIVKAIVENHHGAISVHQTPGGGATFRIDLPISETEDSAPDARKDER
ncbi:MAG: HAMP domain-containing histidine kinase, partial [Brevibacterium aurantiacum]|nr:HAMP domain-containing histidine kinase [Brevibacterium aurantiacum]